MFQALSVKYGVQGAESKLEIFSYNNKRLYNKTWLILIKKKKAKQRR